MPLFPAPRCTRAAQIQTWQAENIPPIWTGEVCIRILQACNEATLTLKIFQELTILWDVTRTLDRFE